jgi:hypothetical protein
MLPTLKAPRKTPSHIDLMPPTAGARLRLRACDFPQLLGATRLRRVKYPRHPRSQTTQPRLFLINNIHKRDKGDRI